MPSKLVCIGNGVGDLIYMSPAFAAYHKEHPDTKLHLITWPGIYADVHKHTPYVEVIPCAGQPNMEQYQYAMSKGFTQNEIVILDNIVNYANFCSKCSEVNIDKWWHVLSSFNMHLIDGYFLNLMGRTPTKVERTPKFFSNGEATGSLSNMIKNVSPYIFVSHSARTDKNRKDWSIDNWTTLLKLVLKNFAINIITVGSEDDPKILINPNGYKGRIYHIRGCILQEIYEIARLSTYSITQQSGMACLMDALPKIPGLQINIGSPSPISGRISKNCKIVDQKNIFDPNSLSVQDVWKPLQNHLAIYVK